MLGLGTLVRLGRESQTRANSSAVRFALTKWLNAPNPGEDGGWTEEELDVYPQSQYLIGYKTTTGLLNTLLGFRLIEPSDQNQKETAQLLFDQAFMVWIFSSVLYF